MGITCDNIYKVLTFESENVSRSVVSNSLRPHGQRSPVGFSPWGFSRQEYWSGLPFPSPGDLPNSGIETGSPKKKKRKKKKKELGLLHYRQILHLLSHQGSLVPMLTSGTGCSLLCWLLGFLTLPRALVFC